ncbi:MAG: hypothetical protein IJK53_07405 [Erysipelotrichaceae bacterium]|nr:hypothetical protein [Clostridia bacterium]MBQ6217196.1 hypothetical protein [Erysipelotrichaceae bacterium]
MVENETVRQKLLNEGFDCYTFYLVTGDEKLICERLNRRYPDSYFLTLRRMMHKSKDGVKWNVEDVLIKRYIFAYIKKGKTIDFLSEIGSLIYVNDCGDEGKLADESYAFAKWMLEINGLLDISKAKLENGLVKITQGPLLQMENNIIKYSRRNRNCLISTNIAGIKVETWLPFEWETETVSG